MGAVGSGPFAGNDVNRRRNLVTGYTKYNTYTPITQLNQLNYDARCSLETSIKLTRVTRGFEPRYRGSARAGQTTEPSAGRKLAAVCLAEVLPVTAADAGRALGPMLPSSARERWPFCVLRDSCHAALPDQPGSPSIGSGRWTGGSRRHPLLIRLATD